LSERDAAARGLKEPVGKTPAGNYIFFKWE
jgi:hypothetical protein